MLLFFFVKGGGGKGEVVYARSDVFSFLTAHLSDK